MPAVVLRHPDLPGQPIVIDVPVGEYIPNEYRDGGYTIDRDTTPAEADEERAETVAAAAQKAAKEAAEFVPEFAPLDEVPADVPVADEGGNAPKAKAAKAVEAPASGSQYANTPTETAAVAADATKEN